MEIVMLRHSLTKGNLARQYIGVTDQPLCAEGIALARRQPADRGLRHVYTSGMRRARETAAILYPGAEQHPLPGLGEMDFGRFEGKSWLDLQGDRAYAAWVDSGCEAPCPGGEDKEGFTRRCLEAFLPLLAQKEAPPALHLVVHGGTIMGLLSSLASPLRDYFDWACPPCGGYRLEVAAPGEARLLRLVEALCPVD